MELEGREKGTPGIGQAGWRMEGAPSSLPLILCCGSSHSGTAGGVESSTGPLEAHPESSMGVLHMDRSLLGAGLFWSSICAGSHSLVSLTRQGSVPPLLALQFFQALLKSYPLRSTVW